jgi:type II pantothenate kinase
MVHAKGCEMNYLGGTGVGGGTLVGLAKLLCGAESVEHISELAEGGSLEKIDLRIKDITAENSLSALARELTVANFGNVSDLAERSDIALGVMNTVFETVAMISIFAARSVGVSDIVLTGNITKIPYCKERFSELERMMAHHGVRFVTPEYSSFATVIGAAIRGLGLN